MEQPRVSVIMATYNQSGTLGEALESLLRQEMPPGSCEIVVVDDGSTDATPDVLKRFAGRVAVIRQPNAGLPAACNAGLALCRGEYLARMDSDDTADPSWLRREMDLLELHPEAVCVYPDYVEVGEDGARTPRPVSEDNLYMLMACGPLMRARAVREAGGYRPFYWEEFDLYLRLREKGPLLHLARPLYFVRRHAASMTASPHRRMEGWEELLKEWGREVLEEAGRSPELEQVLSGKGIGA